MAHKFSAYSASRRLTGTLIYSQSDQTFAFQPHTLDDLAARVGQEGRTSLVLDTLQLETAVETGRALYVWGYMPQTAWQTASLTLPASKDGEIRVEIDDPPLEESISVSISRSNWDVLFDVNTGLVRVVHDQSPPEELVEIADGVHLGLVDTGLNSFWLAPKFVS